MSWKNNYVLANNNQGITILESECECDVYTCVLYVCVRAFFECVNIAEVYHFQLLFQPPSPLELQVQVMTVVQEY